MFSPTIRPGRTPEAAPVGGRLVAYFPNSATGNSTIQYLAALGVPVTSLGVTPPDLMPDCQGMILSIPCRDEDQTRQVETYCRSQGATTYREPTAS